MAPCPVSAGGTEVKADPVNTQVNMMHLPCADEQCHQVLMKSLSLLEQNEQLNELVLLLLADKLWSSLIKLCE